MERSKCPICNKENSQIIFKCRDYRYGIGNEEFVLVKCNDCGLIYLNPRPSQKEIGKFYPKEYYGSEGNFLEKRINKFFQKRIITGLKQYKKSGRMLDFGCGAGKLLLEAKKQGFETFGIEVSNEACLLGRRKGLRIFRGDIKDARFLTDFFDIITLCHVFEHLHDPNLVLKEIHRILKPDGILFMEMPNIKGLSFNLFGKYWFQLDVPRHLYFWSIVSLKRILTINGFHLLKTGSFSLDFPLSLFVSFKFYLRDHKVNSLVEKIALAILFPVFSTLTFLIRIIPGKGETLTICAGKKKILKYV